MLAVQGCDRTSRAPIVKARVSCSFGASRPALTDLCLDGERSVPSGKPNDSHCYTSPSGGAVRGPKILPGLCVATSGYPADLCSNTESVSIDVTTLTAQHLWQAYAADASRHERVSVR